MEPEVAAVAVVRGRPDRWLDRGLPVGQVLAERLTSWLDEGAGVHRADHLGQRALSGAFR